MASAMLNGHDSETSEDGDSMQQNCDPAKTVQRNLLMWLVGTTLVAGLVGGGVGGLLVQSGKTSFSASSFDPNTPAPKDMTGVKLQGVNFGGWLLLEDWFFSGNEGRFVNSQDDDGQGGCFPPEVPTMKKSWPSEGFLVHYLNTTLGPAKTVGAFEAHRRSYIVPEDYRKIAALGLRTIRVPLTWALFADALETVDPGTYGGFNPRNESVVVPDPYYLDSIALVTIPRDFVEEALREAARHGLTVLLDMHCLPGGASQGTFNGVYPLDPMFWKAKSVRGKADLPLYDMGLLIAKAMVSWVEGMGPETRRGVGGLTFMNEPAHLSAIQTAFATEPQILSFFEDTSDIFRKSTLPDLGIKLYLNIVETAFKTFNVTVPKWWFKTFSPEERSTWVIIDLHWYSAWSDEKCSGRVKDGGAYFCDQSLASIRKVWNEGLCARDWATKFKAHFPDSQRATTEMSASTFFDAFTACNSPELTRTFTVEQANVMSEFGIQGFFWSWRIPYGPAFEEGWSLKHMAGMESPPTIPCKPAFDLLSV